MVVHLIHAQPTDSRYQHSQQKIDSLKTIIEAPPTGEEHINALRQLTQLYFTGVYQLDSARKYADILYELSLSEGNERGVALGQYYQGRVADGKGDFATAIRLLSTYLQSDVVKGDSGLLANGLYNMGSVYIHQGNLEKALEYQLRVLRLDEASGNATNIGLSLNNLGIIMKELQRDEEAIAYLERTRAIFDSLGDEPNVALALSNLGGLYAKRGSKSQALEAFETSLEIYEQYEHQRGIALALEHIATLQGQQGLFDEALQKHHQSLQIKQRMELNKEVAESYHFLGVLHQEAGNLDSASYYFEKSLDQAEAVKDKKSLRRAYRSLSKLAAVRGDYQAAYENYRSYHGMSDSILNESSAAQISRLETQYEVESKAAEINNLRAQQLLSNRLRYTLQWALIATAFLGMAAVAFFFYRARVNRNRLKAERELDQMKTRFFANISHEFRTPLTLILGPLRQLQRGDFQGDPQSMYGVMIRNAQRLLTLINQLLDLSKLEEGKAALHAAKGDLVRFVRILVANYTSLADSKDIKYTFFSHEEELMAWFDSDKLEIVVQNLVSNALKFTPHGGEVVVFVGTHHENGKDWAEIIVKDSGIGIKEEELAFVFDRFYQTTNNTKDGSQGTGIGLSLTKELVELHKGTITAMSEEGKGSSFKVQIPIGKKHLEVSQRTAEGNGTLATTTLSVEIETSNAIASSATPEPTLPTILVVEDNPDMREFIAQALQSNFNILKAEDGEEGYQMANDQDPDLIVSDVMMPKMNGTDMCQQLKTEAKTS
ncbi:MAG: tetratricopeptide repeat protein, partial [Bacteroidota bacterium]